MQDAQIPLQIKHRLLHLTMRAPFAIYIKNMSLLLTGENILGVFENSREP